jgi:cation diffusion facilitator family transporter
MAQLSILASLATMALKFWAYLLTGSVGLYSDAAESTVNLVAGLMALAMVVIAARPADEDHAYGHDKAEYFSSGVEGALILVAAASIVYAAVHRFLRPEPLTALGPGLLVAVLAAAVNLAVARIMLRVAKMHDSIAIEADAHHLMTDVWTSVGVVIGLTVVLLAPPEFALLDPLIALAVGMNIVRTGIQLLRRSVGGLMDTALPPQERGQLEEAIRETAGPDIGYHGLRTRKSGARRFVDLHLLLPGATTVQQAHDLCNAVELAIAGRLANSQVTIHVEPREDESAFDFPRPAAGQAAQPGE